MTLGIEAKENSLIELKDLYTHHLLFQAIAGLIRRYRMRILRRNILQKKREEEKQCVHGCDLIGSWY